VSIDASWKELEQACEQSRMRACTQKCKEHGHLEFSVQCDDTSALSPSLKWLLGWIEREVVGWSWLEIRQRPDGTLGLFEPDFQSLPVKFVDSVSNTLLHLFLQKCVAESLGLENEMTVPSLRDGAIVCTEFGSTEGFIMSRVTPKPADSGWFLGCDSEAHDHQSPDAVRRTAAPGFRSTPGDNSERIVHSTVPVSGGRSPHSLEC